jgi:hypothetical protein
MKKKIIMALTVAIALSLAITVYALNQTNLSSNHAADCCAKKDSCPMKDKSDNSADKKSCCDKDDCCKSGDSCPMKNGEKTEGKDSCPMMKKDAEKQTTSSVDMTNVTVASDGESCCQTGADCCKSGSCCKGKKS